MGITTKNEIEELVMGRIVRNKSKQEKVILPENRVVKAEKFDQIDLNDDTEIEHSAKRKSSKGYKDQSWRKLNSKSQSIRKRSTKGVFDWEHVCAALERLAPVADTVCKSVQKYMPEAFETMYTTIPKAVNLLLPLAFNKVLPAKYAGVAYQ